MSRHTEYLEWTIDGAPIMYHKLFRACAVIERAPTEEGDGQRFVFSDLGDFESREHAHERSIAWVKLWIDENFGAP